MSTGNEPSLKGRWRSRGPEGADRDLVGRERRRGRKRTPQAGGFEQLHRRGARGVGGLGAGGIQTIAANAASDSAPCGCAPGGAVATGQRGRSPKARELPCATTAAKQRKETATPEREGNGSSLRRGFYQPGSCALRCDAVRMRVRRAAARWNSVPPAMECGATECDARRENRD